VSRKLISIASAPGWKARFRDDASPDGTRVVTLVSWGLAEGDDGSTEVVGVIQRAASAESPNGRLGLADDVEGFQGYVFTGLATRDTLG
jgi:hypothetical protein